MHSHSSLHYGKTKNTINSEVKKSKGVKKSHTTYLYYSHNVKVGGFLKTTWPLGQNKSTKMTFIIMTR
jgi:hypothetical protein